MRATYRAIAAASLIAPSAVFSTGTLPIGLIARNAGVLLSLPISNSGMAISTRLYAAIIRDWRAWVLPAKESNSKTMLSALLCDSDVGHVARRWARAVLAICDFAAPDEHKYSRAVWLARCASRSRRAPSCRRGEREGRTVVSCVGAMTEAAAPSSDAPVDIVDMTDVEEPELTYKEKVEKAKAEIEAKKAAAKAAAEEKAAAEAAAKAELDEIEAKKHAEIAEKLRIENAEKAEADAKRHAELYGDLAAGQIVRLGGLKARPELNGLTAEIESFVFDTGRVNVKVEPTAIHQQGEVLALKPAALEPLSADEEAKAKAMVVEKLGERSVRVECAGTMLKLTLTPKMLQKPFREAVVAPFLKAFSKKRNEARVLTPDDVYQVTIDSDGQTKL